MFLRTERLRSWLRGRRHVVTAERSDLDVLAEAVGAAWDGATPVAVVPIALFWRPGPRSERRFLNLAYGASDAAERHREGRLVPRQLSQPRGEGRGSDRPHGLRAAAARRGPGRRGPQGAPLDPRLPLPRGEGGRGTDAAAAPPDPGVDPRDAAGARRDRGARARARPLAGGGPRRSREDVPRDRGEHEFDPARDPERGHHRAVPARLRVDRDLGSREGRGLRQEASDRAGAESPLVLRLPAALGALLRAPSRAAAHPGAREHGLRSLRLHLPPRRRLLHAQVARGPALQGGVPRLRRVSGARGLHPGVLHRGHALAHGAHDRAQARLPVVGRRRLSRLPAPRLLLRPDRDHLRAADRGGLDARRAVGRPEEGREHARPGARAEGAAPALGIGAHQLWRADLARRGDRRPARAFRARGDRRGRRREAALRRGPRPARGRADQRRDLRQRHRRRAPAPSSAKPAAACCGTS